MSHDIWQIQIQIVPAVINLLSIKNVHKVKKNKTLRVKK